MKIIIDVTENLYETINNDKYGVHNGRVYDIIRNGTPLDDVKAEIGKCKTRDELQISERDIKSKLMISTIYCNIMEILDSIGKAESEDKE